MKVHWLFIGLVVAAACAVAPVSAKIIEEKDGYIVSTIEDPGNLPTLETAAARLASNTIRQGQSNNHITNVPGGKTTFDSDLNWGNTANSLSLTISAPGITFGPYYDSKDGSINGRITLRIQNAGGLPSGPWTSTVYGYSVSGSQGYSYAGWAS
ncbi:MAG: peptidase domain-containing protein [Methanomicrobiales archaeon]|nr:peptidase domain-containing protein [Methanomicrobiales archaeon]